MQSFYAQALYVLAVNRLDELIDEVGNDEDHPLASLMETLGTLIENYENAHLPEPMGDPLSTLRYLMAEHDLHQNDLPEIGNPKVWAQILSGKRDLDIKQIKVLSQRFHVSPAVFLVQPDRRGLTPPVETGGCYGKPV